MRAFFLGISLACSAAIAGNPVQPPPEKDECCKLNWWTGEGVSLGDWLMPEFTFQSAAGSSTANPQQLAVGHHDPDRHGITIQSLEFSISARLGEHAVAFANYSAKIDHDDHWADEWEEFYLRFSDLPLDAELKGGRFYTHFGYQNQLHPHAFNFVDQYLANGRLAGEDSMAVYGAEISLPIAGRGPSWKDRLTVSFGTVPDEAEEDDEEGFGREAAFEGENAGFQDYLATLDYTVTIAPSAHSQYQFGFAGALGKNHFERHTSLYGAHFQYLWRATEHKDCLTCEEKESGEYFRWRTEVIGRHFEGVSTIEEDENADPVIVPGLPEVRETRQELVGYRAAFGTGGFVPVYRSREVVVRPATPAKKVEPEPAPKPTRDSFSDIGFYTTLSYGFPNGNLHAHLRGEYVSGVSEAGLSERLRVSPAVTWYPPTRLPIYLTLQYNYDHSPSFGDEHSFWAQFTFQWGDCCAHE